MDRKSMKKVWKKAVVIMSALAITVLLAACGTDYSTYATGEDYDAGITVLNNEIAAGRVPDIIYNTGSFDFRIYADKGMLTDFYEMIKAGRKCTMTISL